MESKPVFAAIAASCLAVPAGAANVTFEGSVAPTCTLTVNSNGIMKVSTNLQSLSSHNAGGQAGVVQLTTTGGVQVSVDPVADADIKPSADTSATTWTPTYAATGAHTISETGSATTLSTPGTSTVSVHLAGTKAGSDRFAAGDYSATVVVLCEE
jgi:hypothetical protein